MVGVGAVPKMWDVEAHLGTIPKFEQDAEDADVRKLRNLYTIKLFFLFKELIQISREIIFEGGLVSHEKLDRICENTTNMS